MSHAGDFENGHAPYYGGADAAGKEAPRCAVRSPVAPVCCAGLFKAGRTCYQSRLGCDLRGRFFIAWTARGNHVQVLVRDNNVDQALRALKKKMQREGVFREMKLRRNFEKPSERRAREKAEAVRRYRKLLRKRLEREGY
jgi:small subunit ribosomal protein S21